MAHVAKYIDEKRTFQNPIINWHESNK